jgi:hypothetical protein
MKIKAGVVELLFKLIYPKISSLEKLAHFDLSRDHYLKVVAKLLLSRHNVEIGVIEETQFLHKGSLKIHQVKKKLNIG